MATKTLAQLLGSNTLAPNYSPAGPDPSYNASGASQVSQGNIKQLIYPGLPLSSISTKLYAHCQFWFITGSSHSTNAPVGYNDNSDAQVAAHISAMQSRGFDGLILDWYGQGSTSDSVLQRIKARCEALGNFKFAVCVDKLPTSRTQQLMLDAITYLNTNYFGSSAYLKDGSQPVMFEFGWETPDPPGSVDWSVVTAWRASHGNPKMICQWYSGISWNGFTSPNADGAFDWISPTASDSSTGSITERRQFYTAAQANPTRLAFGSIYKGFNDDLTTGPTADGRGNWGVIPDDIRSMPQRNGQTWLDSLAVISEFYPSGAQLPNLCVPTWDDLEEGSAILTGIDGGNSFANFYIDDSKVLHWSTNGNDSAIASFIVWKSSDGGANFTDVETLDSASHAYDLSNVKGTYIIRVQAVGKASLLNYLSPAVTLSNSTVFSRSNVVSLSLASALHAAEIASTAPFHVLLTVYEPGGTAILRLHYGPDDLTYQGEDYLAFAFQFPQIKRASNGQLPEVQLSICNVNRVLQGYLEQYGGGVGAKVELYVVSDKDLAGWPLEYMEFEITKAHADAMWATFTLGADNPMRSAYPRYIYMANYCRHTFNTPAMQSSNDPAGQMCGYHGSATTCDHRLATCRALNNSKRYGGFPLINRQGFRGASVV